MENNINTDVLEKIERLQILFIAVSLKFFEITPEDIVDQLNEFGDRFADDRFSSNRKMFSNLVLITTSLSEIGRTNPIEYNIVLDKYSKMNEEEFKEFYRNWKKERDEIKIQQSKINETEKNSNLL